MTAHRENVWCGEGNLTRDPELRFTANGTPVCNTGLGQNILRGGEEVPQFFNVTVWGDMAERVAESLVSGDRVMVIGHLEYRTWETDQGDKRSSVDITADSIGPSLRWARATIEKVKPLGNRSNGNGQNPIPQEVLDGSEPF